MFYDRHIEHDVSQDKISSSEPSCQFHLIAIGGQDALHGWKTTLRLGCETRTFAFRMHDFETIDAY